MVKNVVIFTTFVLHLDFGVNASREGKILKTLDGLWSGVFDVNEAFVDFHFESFATGFVDVWGFYDSESAAFGWKRHWSRDGSSGANCSVDDLFCALVDDTVVISLQANADF